MHSLQISNRNQKWLLLQNKLKRLYRIIGKANINLIEMIQTQLSHLLAVQKTNHSNLDVPQVMLTD